MINSAVSRQIINLFHGDAIIPLWIKKFSGCYIYGLDISGYKKVTGIDTYFKYGEELLPGSTLFIHLCCTGCGARPRRAETV